MRGGGWAVLALGLTATAEAAAAPPPAVDPTNSDLVGRICAAAPKPGN